jgi:hypothetical protein
MLRRITLRLTTCFVATFVCCAPVMLASCAFQESEVGRLNARIMLATADLADKGTRDISVTHDVRVDRPYVVVILPAERVSAESIRRADLPLEAKETIQRQNEGRDLAGALVGIVQADRSEWQALAKEVSVGRMLYAWKQKGESVSIGLIHRNGQTVVSAIR